MSIPGRGPSRTLRPLHPSQRDVRSVAPVLAFLASAGTVVGAVLAGSRATTAAMPRRVAVLGLLLVPFGVFAFVTAYADADPEVAGFLDPPPGVLESWALLGVGAAFVAFAYGPLVGLDEGAATAALAVLAVATYLAAPVWLGWRLLGGLDALGPALLSVLLEVGVLAVGAGAGQAVAPDAGRELHLFAALGVAGAAVATYWAAHRDEVAESLGL